MNLLDLLVLALGAGVPLILAVTGETLLQKSGVINIGVEGFMLVGAFAAVVTTQLTGSPWFGVIAGGVAAVATAALFGLVAIELRGDQIVAGAAINFAALGMTGFLYGRDRDLFARMLPPLSGSTAISLAAWTVVPIMAYLFLRFTRTGIRLRACGEYPDAVQLHGFPVRRYRWGALLAEALLTGIAGAYLALALAPGFAENMTSGRGFIALAIVIMARWNTLGAIGATALFSITTALQYRLQAAELGVQFHLLLALPYVVTLLILALFASAGKAPRYLAR